MNKAYIHKNIHRKHYDVYIRYLYLCTSLVVIFINRIVY